MKKKLFFIIFLFFWVCRVGVSQEVWTIGPMLHINFGGERTNVSYAIECAYWNLKHFFYGVDGGIEFGGKRIRIYSEMQTGFLLAGLSAGPLLEINTNEGTTHLGFQSTVWANFFLGLDYRFRYVDKTKYNCVGFYLKVPIADSDGPAGSFLNTSNANGSESHYHHFHHSHHH